MVMTVKTIPENRSKYILIQYVISTSSLEQRSYLQHFSTQYLLIKQSKEKVYSESVAHIQIIQGAGETRALISMGLEYFSSS